MAYCNFATIQALLDVEHLLRGQEIDIDSQIGDAQTVVDAYLAVAGVEVPLGVAPVFIALATGNYVCYSLLRRANATGAFTDQMNAFYTEYKRLMADYVAGRADIPGRADNLRREGSRPRIVNPHEIADNLRR